MQRHQITPQERAAVYDTVKFKIELFIVAFIILLFGCFKYL